MTQQQTNKLNDIQTNYIDIIIRHLTYIKSSNQYTSSSLPCGLEDELRNDVFFYSSANISNEITHNTIECYNQIIDQIIKMDNI